MKYEVELDPEFDDVEDYQKDDDNILDVLVADVNTREKIKTAALHFHFTVECRNGINRYSDAEKFR